MSRSKIQVICLLLALLLVVTACEFRRARRTVVQGVREEVKEVKEEVREIRETVDEAIVGEQDNGETAGPEAGAVPATPLPTATSIFLAAEPQDMESEGHPRLFFDAGDIPGLQARATTTHQGLAERARAFVASRVGTTPSTDLLSRRELDSYRDTGNQMVTLAFACVLTQQDVACELARTYLVALAGWEQWGENGERSLGFSHMVMGNAIAYDWLYPFLSAEEREIVRASLAQRAQELYEASVSNEVVPEWNNWWRNAYVQNHYFTANSALGVAGLALLGEDQRAQQWIDQAAERMTRVQVMLNGIEDGTWHEGMGYQGYALTLSLPFWTNLRKITGVDLFPHDYLRSYPYWRIYNYIPGTTQFVMAYGDIDWDFLGSRTQNVLRFIASEYDDGYAQWMAQEMNLVETRRVDARSSAWLVFEFLYYDPAIEPRPPVDLPLSRVFPDLSGVIWRNGWGEEDLVFALKVGPYGGRFVFDTFVEGVYPWEAPCTTTRCQLSLGHDHADAGTFYIYGGGTWLSSENAGYGDHDTSFHNTLLIDGEGQEWPQREQRRDPRFFLGKDGYLEAAASTEHFDYVAADLTGPYSHLEGIEDITRHVVFIRPDTFVMVDSISSSVPHEYEWIGHFPEGVEVEEPWILGLAAEGQALGVGVASPLPPQVETGNDGLPYIRLSGPERVADQRFVLVLQPTAREAWDSRPEFELLADTGQAVALRVARPEAEGGYDDVLINYGAPGTSIEVGPYELDGQVAVVGWDGNVQTVFMVGGTYLSASGQVLASDLDPDQPFEAIIGE